MGRGVSENQAADPTQPAQAWSPYDVWLTRVKQPRDETLRLRKRDQQDAAMRTEAQATENPAADPAPKPSTA